MEPEGTVIEGYCLVRWGHGPLLRFDSRRQVEEDIPKGHLEIAEVYEVKTTARLMAVKDGVLVG